jgi:hypothetical protein
VTTPLPVLPMIVVEAALVPAEPVSGPGTFLLNDASFGLLDTDVLGDGGTWTDISPYVLGFTVTRPSTRVQGPLLQFQAATASILLDNSDGRFDPDNPGSPYVSGGVSQVHAMIPVRIRANFGAVGYPLFSGFADSWTETADPYNAGYSEWTLAATDGFKVLAGINLAAGGALGSGELSGARVNRILNLAGWYTGTAPGARSIAAGNSTVQATTLGDTALSLMQQASDAEIGLLYVDGAGTLVFRDRLSLISGARSATSQATFGDLPSGVTELPCAGISRADDDTTIANDIQATRVGGGTPVMQEVTDAASIAKYLFPRTYPRSDLILQDDLTVFLWAGWVLYISKDGEDRFEQVTVDPAAQPQDLWPQVLGRDMGDRITIIKRPSGGAFTVTRDVFIAGITHTYNAITSEWATTWTMADATKYGSFLTLDNAITGKLNQNALAFLQVRRLEWRFPSGSLGKS